MLGDSGKLGRIAAALGAADELAFDWDLESGRIDWFGPVAAVLGFEEAAVAGSGGFSALIHPADLSHRFEALARHRATGERFVCRYRLRDANGGFRWVEEQGLVETGVSGRPERLAGTLRRAAAGEPREDRADTGHDPLTGHRRRAELRAAVAEAVANGLKTGRAGAYLAIDIDNLAMVNDAFGFDAGDAVIAELGARLGGMLRGRDIVGRVDGGGFGLLLQNCDAAGLAAIAERVIRALREEPIETAAGPVAATVSLGGVVFPAAAQSADDAMTRAEIALQQAKRAGRNHFVPYRLSEGQRQLMRQGNGIAREVQRALTEDRLLLAYQPLVDARSGGPILYECLLRLRREDGQIMPAGQFVPVVEQLGLMRQIDRRVLDLVVAELEADRQATLAFNISGLTTGDQGWLQALEAHLKDRPDLAARLIVELTETAAMHESEESIRFVAAVRDLGCHVALDDFGAGYSSFRHLKALPVDMVKIDGSYVRDLAQRPENQAFVRTLLGLAGVFGLTTVAECVENAEEAALLAREGVSYLQGWHFGRPELIRPAASAAPVPLPRRAGTAGWRAAG